MADTKKQFAGVVASCREVYRAKLDDYSPAWRLLRLTSVTDQVLNKAKRIRQIGESGVALVNDGVDSEFVGIINYCIMGLVQIELGPTLDPDISKEEALALYDKYAAEAAALMERKNHDYGEAWRGMRLSSMTDLILVKLYRVKQIENHGGKTTVSEGVSSNYLDIINYAVFALIKLRHEAE